MNWAMACTQAIAARSPWSLLSGEDGAEFEDEKFTGTGFHVRLGFHLPYLPL
jgi:hypothetical protein